MELLLLDYFSEVTMSVFHDEVEIEDFEWDPDTESYYYPCPCGDQFVITLQELEDGEEIATCPSCSLIVRVVYDVDQFSHKEVAISQTGLTV
ncbi:DPH3-like [Oopsacas minuta]|uniref:Diphthamide biosynthesis protein 3 n=1 Tax=Oopsacas minuta TaxID=111878 RepID=A0AAV7JVW5_9METZ|nr:DPH3-like [Oopsacas minuta]